MKYLFQILSFRENNRVEKCQRQTNTWKTYAVNMILPNNCKLIKVRHLNRRGFKVNLFLTMLKVYSAEMVTNTLTTKFQLESASLSLLQNMLITFVKLITLLSLISFVRQENPNRIIKAHLNINSLKVISATKLFFQ